jgi:hypothetical protein
VEVICFDFDNWSKKYNEQIIKTFPNVRFIRIHAGKKNITEWLVSTLLEKTFRILSKFFNLPQQLKSYAISKRSYLIEKNIKHVKKADWVVGHNPGALYPSYLASQKLNCKAGFDVEDYHPGEGSDYRSQQLVSQQLNSILPQVDYISFASPLIKNEVIRNIKFTEKLNFILVQNYFSKYDFKINNEEMSTKVKLVWFSQNIDINRGLEKIIPILKKYENQLEIHLYGNVNTEFKKMIYKNESFIKIHGIMASQLLNSELGKYDIGLATEPGKDLNNLLALSNKILCYFQSGLYILATETPAQKLFLSQHHKHGVTFNINFDNFEQTLIETIKNISTIRNQKSTRFSLSQMHNWENESQVLLNTWKAK